MELLSIIVSSVSCFGLPSWACDAQLRTGLDPRLLVAICQVESNGDTKALHAEDGSSSSYGVCQIKLRTAQGLGFDGTAAELMQPTTNAHFAAKYILVHIRKYKDIRKAVSAYNAGRAIHSNSGYVNKVMSNYQVLLAGGGQ